MAILAMRERRRYLQLRRLGVKVPISYTRIWGFVTLPKKIQEEIMKYPSCLEDDSEYEDDSVVLSKYSSTYISI